VKDGDAHLTSKRFFDIKALRSLDIFQVDTTKGWGNGTGDIDDLIRVVGVHLDIEYIHIGKPLKEHALAFHDRLLASATLTNWVPIATNQVGADGTALFKVNVGPGNSPRFFRVAVP
jgi:hypothetical protein